MIVKHIKNIQSILWIFDCDCKIIFVKEFEKLNPKDLEDVYNSIISHPKKSNTDNIGLIQTCELHNDEDLIKLVRLLSNENKNCKNCNCKNNCTK